MMRSIPLSAALLVLASTLVAAPNREPSGKSATEELPTIELNRIGRDEGARFGDWNIWRSDEGGESYFFLNQKTGLGLYLYWGSNGWVNYRTGDGAWYVLFPTGTPSLQDRKELKLERFLGKQPSVRVAPGNYKVQGWTLAVTPDAIEMHTPSVRSTINLRAAAPEFSHNGRTIGGK